MRGRLQRVFRFRLALQHSSRAKLLTRDEARRMAVNFAKLPVLLRSGRSS